MGYTDPPTDSHYQFDYDSSFQTYYGLTENKHDLPPIKEMIAKGQPFFIYFLYRQSPEYLEPLDSVKVSENEPPVTVTNMANVKLDVRGRLIEFVAVPPRDDLSPGDNEFDWSVIFAEAGLDFGKFNETKSNRIPPVFADKRKSVAGQYGRFSGDTDSRRVGGI